MIRDRKARIDAFRRLEEESVYKKCEADELRSRLKNKYRRREGLLVEIRQSKETARRASERSFRRVVHSIAGSADRDAAKQGIRRNYALDSLGAMNREIEQMERLTVQSMKERVDSRNRLEEDRPYADELLRELKDFVRSLHPEKKKAVETYLQADRRRILLEAVCAAGNAYYKKLKALSSRMQGASRLAAKPLGKNPGWEMLLQEAYTVQGMEMSESAESLQIQLITKLHASETMLHTKYPIAGKIAFSPYLFESTFTSLLATRRGDELKRLLDTALNETAELLLSIEQEKEEAVAQWEKALEDAGLTE